MIHYIRKPQRRPRRYYSIAHNAWSDYILHRENLNPYRDGTPEHDAYNEAYTLCEEALTTAAHLQQKLQNEDTGKTLPSDTTSHNERIPKMCTIRCSQCGEYLDTLTPHVVEGTSDLYHLECIQQIEHFQSAYYVLHVPKNI